MKKIFIIATTTALFLAGCEYQPYADFSASNQLVGINERVSFSNLSSNADYYEWDFGDGSYSNQYNASHSYAAPGIYRVELRAYNDDVVSVATTQIEVINALDFEASTTVTDIGFNIFFTNYSSGADYYEWNFGDGTIYRGYDAVHSYNSYNDFTVTLTGFNNGRVTGQATLMVSTYPTDLEVEVLEYYDEYPIYDASIILYSNYSDWLNEAYPIVEGYSNKFGLAYFTGLSDQSYFLDIWHPNHNNYLLADENIDFIKTEPLTPGYINTFIAYVDYVVVNGKEMPRIELKKNGVKLKSNKARVDKDNKRQDKRKHPARK